MQLTKPLKHMAILTLIGISALSLAGCAHFIHQLGYQRIATKRTAPCANAKVLLTNLQQPINKRRYQLPNGAQCAEEISHDKQSQQAKGALETSFQ